MIWSSSVGLLQYLFLVYCLMRNHVTLLLYSRRSWCILHIYLVQPYKVIVGKEIHISRTQSDCIKENSHFHMYCTATQPNSPSPTKLPQQRAQDPLKSRATARSIPMDGWTNLTSLQLKQSLSPCALLVQGSTCSNKLVQKASTTPLPISALNEFGLCLSQFLCNPANQPGGFRQITGHLTIEIA